jgi:hypothetical protein
LQPTSSGLSLNTGCKLTIFRNLGHAPNYKILEFLQRPTQPSSQAATSVAAENASARVYNWIIAPGASTPMHSHETPHLIVAATPMRLKMTAPDGQSRSEEVTTGDQGFTPSNKVAVTRLVLKPDQVKGIGRHWSPRPAALVSTGERWRKPAVLNNVASTSTSIRFTPLAASSKGGSWLSVSPSGSGCCFTPTGLDASVNASNLFWVRSLFIGSNPKVTHSLENDGVGLFGYPRRIRTRRRQESELRECCDQRGGAALFTGPRARQGEG